MLYVLLVAELTYTRPNTSVLVLRLQLEAEATDYMYCHPFTIRSRIYSTDRVIIKLCTLTSFCIAAVSERLVTEYL